MSLLRIFELQNLKKMKAIAHETEQRKSFYLALQNSHALDLRDNRGKIHNMSLVLLGLIVSFLRGKDGSLSNLHRGMSKKQRALCILLNIEYEPVISRSHLPVFLKKVNFECLGQLVIEHFGISLTVEAKVWLALDGKELRGSILWGHTRGAAIVQALTHVGRQVYSQGYYNGSKESERPVVEHLLLDKTLASQKLTFDALHFTPQVLTRISKSQGIYIAGLKGNQEELYLDMQQIPKLLKPAYQLDSKEKGHGREDKRHYKCFNVSKEYFDKRWKDAGFQTLIEVKRERLETKKAKYSQETSYYMSNAKTGSQAQAEELFKAVREHWSIETNNHIRDVSLKEDSLKSIEKNIALTTSVIRTLITNVLQINKPPNLVALMDDFAEDFSLLTDFIRNVNFL